MHLVDPLRANKKQELVLPPSQNLLRAGHVPVGCIYLSSSRNGLNGCRGLSRAFTVDTLRAKKQELVLPPSQNLLRAGHVPDYPLDAYIFQARAMAAAASRARLHSWRVAMH